MSAPPKLLTVREVAEILRCAPKTVRRRIHRGDILATKPAGAQCWLVPESEVKRHINDGVNADAQT